VEREDDLREQARGIKKARRGEEEIFREITNSRRFRKEKERRARKTLKSTELSGFKFDTEQRKQGMVA